MVDVVRIATDFTVIAMILVGVWQFRTPRGALRGNAIAAAALALAIVLVAMRHQILVPGLVAGLLAVGAVGGFWLARKVKMIQAPAMVAIQH
ncbi:MAG: NAD(P)(+) transhydrogenase (Re/Si-specific) subunit beta, partial [Gemmatimonadetes bacterium]|nr:NAD(P)(+) transhydrogenase (Re/Si-specific) subunit beta [Gemmatimonadota bacterium]